MATTTYRTNSDGSAVCPHRDLSCCGTCVATDDALVEVVGAHYFVGSEEERALLADLLDSDGSIVLPSVTR
jgi:hypothetical protein